MPPKNETLDRVCSHPPVPPPEKQVAKCALCMKPLGRDAMVSVQGKAFCCNAAAEQFFQSNQHYQDYLAREGKGKFGRLVKKLVILLIVVGIAAVAYVKRDAIMKFVNEKTGKAAPAEPAESQPRQ